MKTRTYFERASDSGCGNTFGITSRDMASPIKELISMATHVGMSPSSDANPIFPLGMRVQAH